ncbi:NCS2 family permease [Christensenellaceae bacterium NSJ-44]|jgi:AGZA family xanthine/uracil permease-like MFS transporter|uniref:NCS2 family permease n=1 Tax=Luoshenia tenuis TaxID=2763654 RepID=A0A926D174_9FIRM|nr:MULTISPECIES: NCS2 family permease [Clostridia]MBC8529482.1 NCS2 family permease [Luoshenia tenuis]
MEKLFKLKEHGTNVRTEITAGITTFLAMAYILIVNPLMLSGADAGVALMDFNAVFLATAISAAIATLCMAFLANYPVALASGMGLNAYFTYSVCLGMNVPWQVALTAVLVEGIIFILLSLFKFRETLVNTIPANLKLGITAGIGLFITLVGLKGAGIVIASESTLVDLGRVVSPEFALAMIGLLVIGALHHHNVKGSILLGILITWVLGMIAQGIGWYQGNSLLPDFSNWTLLPVVQQSTFFQFDFAWVGEHLLDFAVIVFSFLFVDLFDTVGTLVGVASKGNLLDKDGKLPRAGRALMSDAIGTVVGACLGTSTVTSYVESSAGVAEGGRTGLTALTTAVLFIVAIFFYPIFTAIPGFATAPALVFVGLLMMGSVKKMEFEGDIADTLGGFVAIIMMPFTYSIANGIMFGMLTWVILKLLTGKVRDIHPVMWVCFALFALRIITMAI